MTRSQHASPGALAAATGYGSPWAVCGALLAPQALPGFDRIRDFTCATAATGPGGNR
jgi:hypothetical protein